MQACSLLPMSWTGGPCGALAGAFNTRKELLLQHCSETRKRLKDLTCPATQAAAGGGQRVALTAVEVLGQTRN